MPSTGVERWSTGDLWTTHSGAMTRVFLEIRGEGVLVLACSSGHEDGKLRPEEAAAFTRETIAYGTDTPVKSA